MSDRIFVPQWRDEARTTKFPFAEVASLTNDDVFIPEGVFLDAALYPVGGQDSMFISKVNITDSTAVITIGDSQNTAIASGSTDLLASSAVIALQDALGRPAGVFVVDPTQTAAIQAWPPGDHEFDVTQTGLAATCCCPTPEVGLLGILLDDGTLLTGDIWLVGSAGVVLNKETVSLPNACNDDVEDTTTIRVDIVGDPLYLRRLCTPSELFVTPRLLKTITVLNGAYSFQCGPDANGDFKLQVSNNLAADTALRVRMLDAGIQIEMLGTLIRGQN